MAEGQVPVWVRMWFLRNSLSVVLVVVMRFMMMEVVMLDFLMPVRMRMMCAKE